MMMMMIFLLQATAADGPEVGVLQIMHGASPPPFSISAKCDAVRSWAKKNTKFLAANYLWDGMKRWNPLLYFHLHPFCPTRTCYKGKNKSTSLFFPVIIAHTG